MAIEAEDLQMIKLVRDRHPIGSSCAILGDCHIHGNTLESFGDMLGFDRVDTFDINGNPTYKLDLNDPIPSELVAQYDYVIDSGTLYCCFDISSTWKNILSLLKEEGFIIHTSNLAGFYGRGFYSFSPALFRDFYHDNNFIIQHMATKTRHGRTWRLFNPENTYLKSASNQELEFQRQSGDYISFIPNDALILCCAHRERSVPFTKPVPRHFIETSGR